MSDSRMLAGRYSITQARGSAPSSSEWCDYHEGVGAVRLVGRKQRGCTILRGNQPGCCQDKAKRGHTQRPGVGYAPGMPRHPSTATTLDSFAISQLVSTGLHYLGCFGGICKFICARRGLCKSAAQTQERPIVMSEQALSLMTHGDSLSEQSSITRGSSRDPTWARSAGLSLFSPPK